MRVKLPNRHRFRGQNMVEFALVSPLFFFMFFAVIEGGWLLFNQNEITNASRDGARYAAVHGTQSQNISTAAQISSYVVSTTDVKAAIVKRLSISDPNNIQVTVTRPDGDMVPGHHITVVVTYHYQPLIGYMFGNKTFTLSSTSTSVIYY
jgi:Flp pilus assembly protein TadG